MAILKVSGYFYKVQTHGDSLTLDSHSQDRRIEDTHTASLESDCASSVWTLRDTYSLPSRMKSYEVKNILSNRTARKRQDPSNGSEDETGCKSMKRTTGKKNNAWEAKSSVRLMILNWKGKICHLQKIESICIFVFKECSVDFFGKSYTKVQRDVVA